MTEAQQEPTPPKCVICRSTGPFTSYAGRPGEVCSGCGSLRRHRDNYVVMQRLGILQMPARSRMLMVSIDPYWKRLKRHFDLTILLKQHDIPGTIYGDICTPPFKARSFRVVTASHVLEHVHNDAKAIAMIFQLLIPGGFFVANVPCSGDKTVEYGRPDPRQHGHWRLYGRKDFVSLLKQTGFVRVINPLGTAFGAMRPL